MTIKKKKNLLNASTTSNILSKTSHDVYDQNKSFTYKLAHKYNKIKEKKTFYIIVQNYNKNANNGY